MYRKTRIFSSFHATVHLPSALVFHSLEIISWEEKVHYGLFQLMFIQGISWKSTRSGRLLSVFDSRVIWALLAPDLCWYATRCMGRREVTYLLYPQNAHPKALVILLHKNKNRLHRRSRQSYAVCFSGPVTYCCMQLHKLHGNLFKNNVRWLDYMLDETFGFRQRAGFYCLSKPPDRLWGPPSRLLSE